MTVITGTEYKYITAILNGWSIDVEAEYDTQTQEVLWVSRDGKEPIPSMYIKVRKTDRNFNPPIPRPHDARLVSSNVDWRKGIIESVMQLSDMFIPLDIVLKASAIVAIRRGKSLINMMDDDVLAIAISECSYQENVHDR